MIEEDFIIRTLREGSIRTDQAIEAIITQMGITLMTDRFLGSVAVLTEVENGQVTRAKIRWGQDNDPAFDKSLQPMAEKLLAEEERILLAAGPGGPGNLKIKIVAKK